MSQTPHLHVATYHYVRDLPRTRFPLIKGMLLNDFRRQVKALPDLFEMATLNSALDFLNGRFQPRRDLCLMTFDDGLREHYTEVAPILAEQRIQGVFFPITSCLEYQIVAPVHMNHFLMAGLGFDRYRSLFTEALHALGLDTQSETRIDEAVIRRTYPLDSDEIARFKYLFNFLVPAAQRDLAVKNVFETWIGDENGFAADLYFNWAEACEMQTAGMVIGGHSHQHRPLASLSRVEMEQDLEECWALMRTNLNSQELWPFSYPYGKSDSFSEQVVATLRRLGFCCSLCTEAGANLPGVDLFAIRRLDGKQVILSNQHESGPPPKTSQARSVGVTQPF